MNEQDWTLSGPGLSLVEVLASLSYALDLTGGQPMGHAQRSCLIAMRIGQVVGLNAEMLSSLYFATLMKDAGCSSNAARMYELFGSDDIAVKKNASVTDWSNLFEAAKYAAANTLPHGSLLARASRMISLGIRQKEVSHEIMHARCERGSQIALAIGLGNLSAECIHTINEHWDGCGEPQHLHGDRIPILARISGLAQNLEVYAKTFNIDTAYDVVRKRSGKWFDPEIVKAAESFRSDTAFWDGVWTDTRDNLIHLEFSATLDRASETRIDAICDAFAQIVDAKSSFTAQHSFRVRDYTVEIATELGFSANRLTTIRRAALLHDVGKLGVSNAILDKPGKPTDEEWASIRKHPYYSEQILGQITGFSRLAEIAAAHHERLDGRGYFRGLPADKLDLDMRILAVADVFDALAAERPYRGAMDMNQVFEILDKDAGIALDADCIDVLRCHYHHGSTPAHLRVAA